MQACVPALEAESTMQMLLVEARIAQVARQKERLDRHLQRL